MESLQAHGLRFSRESFSSLDPDDIKFFLKQQQKRLADSQGSKEEGDSYHTTLQESYIFRCVLISNRSFATELSISCLPLHPGIIC